MINNFDDIQWIPGPRHSTDIGEVRDGRKLYFSILREPAGPMGSRWRYALTNVDRSLFHSNDVNAVSKEEAIGMFNKAYRKLVGDKNETEY